MSDNLQYFSYAVVGLMVFKFMKVYRVAIRFRLE